MAIENRNLAVRTKLVVRYKGKDYSATVVEGEGGSLRFRLEDGREFKSLSSAGSVLMDGHACNGWRFWSVATEQTEEAKAKEKKKAKPEPDFDCRCANYQPGAEGCSWRNPGTAPPSSAASTTE